MAENPRVILTGFADEAANQKTAEQPNQEDKDKTT